MLEDRVTGSILQIPFILTIGFHYLIIQFTHTGHFCHEDNLKFILKKLFGGWRAVLAFESPDALPENQSSIPAPTWWLTACL